MELDMSMTSPKKIKCKEKHNKTKPSQKTLN